MDTLKELFEGNEALFEGLHAAAHWNWSVAYPVIRLSLGGGVVKTQEDLAELVGQQLARLEANKQAASAFAGLGRRLQALIQHLHSQSGQRVVVLIDEYDKPILDNLREPELAREMRDSLRNLYAVLKDSDAHIKFVFITGVSKFSKVNLFSGLNNLNDITIDAPYSAICGYTDADIDSVFAPELPGLDREQIQRWYNGYNWTGEAVYNPFDLLLLFQKRQFKSYWFETGTPTFLVDFLARHHWFTPDLARLQTSEALLSSFDIEKMSAEALLWQTGYLTFHQVQQSRAGNWLYTLGYPNREVEAALNDALLAVYRPAPQAAFMARSQLEEALYQHNTESLRNSLHAFFASIPQDWYRKSPLAQYEGYYASLFYSQLAALGLDVRREDVTNASVVGDLWSRTNEDSTRYGRIDLSLKLEQQVYLFEFKVTEQAPEGKALQQLIDRDYAEKYRAPGVRITLIGIEFSKAERNIVGWETLQLPTAQDIAQG